MDKKLKRLNDFIALVESRPLMLFNNEPTYNELSALILGYFEGLWDVNPPINMSSWLKDTHRHKTSLHWQSYIYLIAAEDDEKAKKILFKELYNYVAAIEQKMNEIKFIEKNK